MFCEDFSKWALGQKWSGLAPEAQTKIGLIALDTLGCAIAGRDHPAAIKSAKVAQQSLGGPSAATGLTGGAKLPILGAILDSGAAIRALDLNDIYWGRASGGHPSDIFAAAFAIGEAVNASYFDVLTSVAAGYEMFIRLADAMDFRKLYDHTTASCMGAAVIAGYLKKLDSERMGHGLAIAFTSSPRLGVLRRGRVSELKAPAPALAEISGVLAMDLAEATVTGPMEGVESPDGAAIMFHQGTTIAALLPKPGDALRLLEVAIKRYPCIGTGQTTVATGVALHHKLGGRTDHVRKLHLRVQDDQVARNQIGEAYRHADTRETADHSLWALFGMSLFDGRLSPAQFAAQRWKDTEVEALLTKTTIAADLKSDEPGRLSAAATATLADGSTVEIDTPYAPGHAKNPLDEAGVVVKFHECADPVLGKAKADAIVSAWRKADTKTSIRELIALSF
jgi:2-methylcitrate dehydratase